MREIKKFIIKCFHHFILMCLCIYDDEVAFKFEITKIYKLEYTPAEPEDEITKEGFEDLQGMLDEAILAPGGVHAPKCQ